MVNYSVTIDILPAREREWVTYMLRHIQDVLNTGHFRDFSFKKLQPKRTGYARYRVEYYCETMQDYDAYMANGATRLQAEHAALFKDAFIPEREVTEFDDVVNEVYYGNPSRLFSEAVV